MATFGDMTLPKNNPIRKPNLYLGFPPAKWANPIRLVMNPGAPSASRRASYKHDSVGS